MARSPDTTREIDSSLLSRKWRKKMRQLPKPPLAHTHPEVAEQWHPSKNGSLTAGGLDLWIQRQCVVAFARYIRRMCGKPRSTRAANEAASSGAVVRFVQARKLASQIL